MIRYPQESIELRPHQWAAVAERQERIAATLDPQRRRRLGQYFTPSNVAALMASFVDSGQNPIRILEPGAGTGSLIAATVETLCTRTIRPSAISVTAIEIDPALQPALEETISECQRSCHRAGIRFEAEIIQDDFLKWACQALEEQLSFHATRRPSYDLVILNPPYRKIGSDSSERRLLRRIGVEVPNLYAAFLAASAYLLAESGQMIAITPRSFCNGRYFRAFRNVFLQRVALTRVHVVESRREAFAADGVLQENIIFRAVRGTRQDPVIVTHGGSSLDAVSYGREITYDQLIHPDDPDLFIHLSPEPRDGYITRIIRRQSSSLDDLGIQVSTGRVVDFRARDYLRHDPAEDTAPLIYPMHFERARIRWPKKGRKPNAILVTPRTMEMLVPPGTYVVVKRFSAKEEPRRIMAALCDSTLLGAKHGIAFENHLNFFHCDGRGIDPDIATGLVSYLNSSFVDQYFRQFSGHTQVNAGDLRKLRYPSPDELRRIGRECDPDNLDDPSVIDSIVAACVNF